MLIARSFIYAKKSTFLAICRVRYRNGARYFTALYIRVDGLANFRAYFRRQRKHLRAYENTLFPYAVFRDFPKLLFQGRQGLLVDKRAVWSIPTLFYTFQGAFGEPPAWLNILFFFLSAFIGYALEYILFIKAKGKKWWNILSWSALGIMVILFVAFTFYPPKLPLFLDPLTKTYGLI